MDETRPEVGARPPNHADSDKEPTDANGKDRVTAKIFGGQALTKAPPPQKVVAKDKPVSQLSPQEKARLRAHLDASYAMYLKKIRDAAMLNGIILPEKPSTSALSANELNQLHENLLLAGKRGPKRIPPEDEDGEDDMNFQELLSELEEPDNK